MGNATATASPPAEGATCASDATASTSMADAPTTLPSESVPYQAPGLAYASLPLQDGSEDQRDPSEEGRPASLPRRGARGLLGESIGSAMHGSTAEGRQESSEEGDSLFGGNLPLRLDSSHLGRSNLLANSVPLNGLASSFLNSFSAVRGIFAQSTGFPEAPRHGHSSASIPLGRLTFTDESLLRGVSLPGLLWRFGRHFQASSLADHRFTEEEAEWLWGHSRSKPRLDEFVSHCWRDGPMEKYLTLCLYYNGLPAALACLSLALVTFSLELAGVLPGWMHFDVETDAGTTETHVFHCWCTLVGAAAYPAALLSWHHVPSWLGGGHDRAAFFDKLCIHQADAARKEAGIRSLAAFVASSDRFLLLWSPEYFSRLWCNLEVATLVYLHRAAASQGGLAGRLVFRPLRFSVFAWVFGAFVQTMFLLTLLLLSFLTWLPGERAVGVVFATVVPLAGVCGAHSLRACVWERNALTAQLDDFEVESASCCGEKYRQLIYETIEEWFGTLTNFNTYVRTDVAECVRASIPNNTQFPLPTIAGAYVILAFLMLDWVVWCYQLSDSSARWTRCLRGLAVPLIMDLFINLALRISDLPWAKPRRSGAFHDWVVSSLVGLLSAGPCLLHMAAVRTVAAGPRRMALYTALLAVCAGAWRLVPSRGGR